MKVRAAVVKELNGPWVTEDIEIDEPHPGEVKVKMAYAGMCHSDEHLRDGGISQSPEVLEMLGISMFPTIGGHEGSGIVESVGEGVSGFAPGDHVAVSFVPGCGKCEPCVAGTTYLCDMTAFTLAGPMMSDGTWRHRLGDQNLNRMAQLGTFSEFIVVNEASLVKIDPWLDLRAAALISCGISTGFGSVVERGGIKPGEVAVVVGCGGVGSGAIQGARIGGARAIVAVDTNQTKVDRAMKIGATHGATSILDAAFNIMPDLTFGKNADVVVLTPGTLTGEMIEQARSITSKGGRIVVTALAPWNENSVELNLFMFAMSNQAMLGTVFGSANPKAQIPRLLRLHEKGLLDIDTIITKEYSIEEVQQGYEDLEAGLNVRGVVKFD